MVTDSAESQRNTIWIVGHIDSPEMQPVAESLNTLAPTSKTRNFPTLSELLENESHPSPHLIIVCQSWPLEYPAQQVQQGLAAHPLTRWICCYGPWCASDDRNLGYWPVSVRIPVNDFPHRLNQELNIIHGTLHPLPLTASREETFQFDFTTSHPSPPSRNLRVAIHTTDPAFKNNLTQIIQEAGSTLVPLDNNPQFILWDTETTSIEQIKTNANIIALTSSFQQTRSSEFPSARMIAIAGKLTLNTKLPVLLSTLDCSQHHPEC